MTKFQFPISEIKRATATVLLTVGVAVAYFTVAPGLFEPSSRAHEVEVENAQPRLPHKPAGGRRWRSSNAEQSQNISLSLSDRNGVFADFALASPDHSKGDALAYFPEADPWGRNRAALENAMSLFQMSGTFSSVEIAGGTIRVTLTKDYLAGYLATAFLGGDEPITFALDDGEKNRPFVVGPVIVSAFKAELFAKR